MTNPDDPAVEAAVLAHCKTMAPECDCAGRCEVSSEADIDAMRAAILAAERAAWRGIETAPRDGTPILVAVAGGEFHASSAEWRNGVWCIQDTARMLLVAPTHWRPLPAPPDGGGDV